MKKNTYITLKTTSINGGNTRLEANVLVELSEQQAEFLLVGGFVALHVTPDVGPVIDEPADKAGEAPTRKSKKAAT